MRKRRTRGQKNKFNIVLFLMLLIVIAIIAYGLIITSKEPDKDENDNSNLIATEGNNSSTTEGKDSEDEKLTEEESKENNENKETEEYSFEDGTGEEEVKIDANKVVVATGFAGASNYKYYLRGTTLYFIDTSDSNNEEVILAYNVRDIYLENKTVTAVLYSDGKVVTENNYIVYK